MTGKTIFQAKVDKRDLPENNRFFCEACDRGYKDEEKYNLHVAGHQKVHLLVLGGGGGGGGGS